MILNTPEQAKEAGARTSPHQVGTFGSSIQWKVYINHYWCQIALFSQSQVYMYDFFDDQWTELNSMQTGRLYHGCGLARKQDGALQVVVAGGVKNDSIEILDLDTMTWRYAATNI